MRGPIRWTACWASLALAAGCQLGGEPVTTDEVVTVRVNISCFADSTLAFALSPWVRQVPYGASIEWRVDPPLAGEIDTFYVVPKSKGANWPYQATGKMHGRPGMPARAAGMKSSVKNGQVGRYDIVTVCIPPGPTTHRLRAVIDPDVVVDRAR